MSDPSVASSPSSDSDALQVKALHPSDISQLVGLDALVTGEAKEDYWDSVFGRFLREEAAIGLGAFRGKQLDGYLFAELRAFEFGSEACGWVFAVGVHPEAARAGVASALLAEARARFRELGVRSLRTMVRRTDVPLLSFFRRHGFVGGPFVQLELDVSSPGTQHEEVS